MGKVNWENTMIGSKYKIKKRLGCGSFGEVFQAQYTSSKSDTDNLSVQCAVKVESNSNAFSQLELEYLLYGQLLNVTEDAKKNLPRAIGIPQIYYFSKNERGHSALVMEMLGPSLEDLFQICARKFTPATTVVLAEQLVERIWYLHIREWLHRDIKPDNFLMGLGDERKQRTVYIIDLGLCKKYVTKKDGKRMHIPYREGKSLTGTARYCGSNVHCGLEQSRRDDMEAIAYVLVYFLKGTLPWQGVMANSRKTKYEKIAELKARTSPEELCSGVPDEFTKFLSDVKSLKFEDEPDYIEYLRLFRDLHRQFKRPVVLDWVKYVQPVDDSNLLTVDGFGGKRKSIKSRVDASHIVALPSTLRSALSRMRNSLRSSSRKPSNVEEIPEEAVDQHHDEGEYESPDPDVNLPSPGEGGGRTSKS